jgi:hypothetical protein
VFSLRNLIAPLKFLLSLLLGYRYLNREERLNKQKLESLWHAHGLGQSKKQTYFGMSKMLLKSAILAIVGFITSAVVFVWYRRKQRALKLIQEKEERRR